MSYVYPVTLRRSAGSTGYALELYLYCNQLQLGDAEILYSDGKRYRPVIAVTQQLKDFLPSVKNVLVLGTGIGSIVRILHGKGYRPEYTLVEYDQVVLQWAMESLDELQGVKMEPVCADAQSYMAANRRKYDLIFIDIFVGRVVPEFVTSSDFLQQCGESLSNNGKLALNYIVNNEAEWQQARHNFSAVFPSFTIATQQVNRILIAG